MPTFVISIIYHKESSVCVLPAAHKRTRNLENKHSHNMALDNLIQFSSILFRGDNSTDETKIWKGVYSNRSREVHF